MALGNDSKSAAEIAAKQVRVFYSPFISGKMMHVVGFPPFVSNGNNLWRIFTFPVHQSPSRYGPTLTGKNLFLRSEFYHFRIDPYG